MTFRIQFQSEGRQARNPPNPAYPNGLHADISDGASKTCTIDLTYPAECVGTWIAECEACHKRIAITAAGRTDDPRTVKVACKGN